MFEEKTFENIMDSMLDNIPDEIDKREGSLIYDALAPCALELANAYSDLGLVLDECFADSASYYYLIKRAAERGIIVKEGDAAILEIAVEPVETELEIGSAFSIGALDYTVTEALNEQGHYALTCEETGVDGNNTTDEVIPDDDIEDLESVEVVAIIRPGTEDEDEESLRDRYMTSFVDVAFGGNIADYKEKATSYSEVGACRVYPAWNGGGTVKLSLLGADFSPASNQVVSGMQEIFDPTQQGEGVGLAPVGHTVTVVACDSDTINVSNTIVYADGYSWEDISESFGIAMDEYLLDLRKTWDDIDLLSIRTGKIEEILMALEGVENVTNVSINSGSGNYSVQTGKVPIGGVYSG